jgi:PAS domain S-box-containing protein
MARKASKVFPMARSAAQARPRVRPDVAGRHPDRAIIDAALAVNEAPTLNDAFAALVRVGQDLLRADRVSVAVWDEGLNRGVIRAVAGVDRDSIGGEIRPGTNNAYRTVVVGKPVVTREISADGLDPRAAECVADIVAYAGVSLSDEGFPPVTFHAAWLHDVPDHELHLGVETLGALGALTRVAYRTERERLDLHQQARFEAVLDSVADGMVVRTEAGLVLNRTARRLLELDPEDAFDPQAPPPDPREDRALTVPELVAFFVAGTPGERRFRYRVALPSGREAVLDGTTAPIFEPVSGEPGSVTVFRDVTAEHNREFLTEQLLERLFETLPIAIGVADPLTHEMLSVNQAFVRLLGFPEEQAVGCGPPYPWLASREDAEPPAPLSPTESVEALLRHQDGRLISVALRRFPIPGPDGMPVALVTLISDLSEQRRFEQQLLQSGKLATIGELAAGVAHEINNPLFAILGLLEFLLKEVEPGTKPYERLVLIQQTGLEIKEIVRALLDFAREPSEERALISVSDVARETVELVRRTSAAKAVEIVEVYDDKPTPVVGSPNQLKQIFLNLVANANQALGGDEGVIEVAVRREQDWVVARVSDDGPGLPEDTLARIFEPFFTTKRAAGGSGLGLSVSHGIAEAHGGSLTAENRPEGGARFTLRLPVEEAA